MNLNHIPPELTDELFGDPESRRNLERSAEQKTEIEFTLPDATGDCSAIVDETEENALIEMLTGGTADTSTGTGVVAKITNAVMVSLKGKSVTLPRGLKTSFKCGYVGVLPEKFYRSDTTQAVRSYLTACLDDQVPAAKLSALQALAEAS